MPTRTGKEPVARLNLVEFLNKVSEQSGVPYKDVQKVYAAMVEEILDTTVQGHNIVLAGFGKFYAQRHRGHKARFGQLGEQQIKDYMVLKFSATRTMNQRLEHEIEQRSMSEDNAS